MNYRMLLARAVFGGLAMAGYASAGVLNGGFEDATFSAWTQIGDTSFTTVTGPSSSTCGDIPLGNCGVHSGSYAAFFGNTLSGGITQQVATVQGETYVVDFWLAVGMDGNTRNSSAYTISLGPTIFGVVDPGPDPVWRHLFFTAVAGAGTNSLLSFSFRDDRDTFGLDDVNVTSSAAPVDGTTTPEPVSMILTGTSLVALAGLSRMLRRSRR